MSLKKSSKTSIQDNFAIPSTIYDMDIKLLTFTESYHGDPMAKIGNIVYFIDEEYKDQASIGESWFCQPLRVIGTSGFLRPLMRLDDRFIMNAISDEEKCKLTETICREHPEFIQEIASRYEAKISELDQTIARLTVDLQREIDKQSVEIVTDCINTNEHSKRKEPVTITEKVSDYEYKIIEENNSLAREWPDALKKITRNRTLTHDLWHKNIAMMLRTDARILQCDCLDNGTYSVYVSPNRETMVIRRDDDGKVNCKDGTLEIWALETILGKYTEDEIIIADHDHKNGMLSFQTDDVRCKKN